MELHLVRQGQGLHEDQRHTFPSSAPSDTAGASGQVLRVLVGFRNYLLPSGGSDAVLAFQVCLYTLSAGTPPTFLSDDKHSNLNTVQGQLHLYVPDLQYSENVGASLRLQVAKERVRLAKQRIKEKQRTPIASPEVQVLLLAAEQREEESDMLAERNASRVGEQARAPQSSESNVSNKEDEELLLRDVPTYIFLDTCAVIRMSERRRFIADSLESELARYSRKAVKKKSVPNERSGDASQCEGYKAEAMKAAIQSMGPSIAEKTNEKRSSKSKHTNQTETQPPFSIFTFENLVEEAIKGKFGESLAHPGDQVTLVITGTQGAKLKSLSSFFTPDSIGYADTVMQELDHLKSSKPTLFRNILYLQVGLI